MIFCLVLISLSRSASRFFFKFFTASKDYFKKVLILIFQFAPSSRCNVWLSPSSTSPAPSHWSSSTSPRPRSDRSDRATASRASQPPRPRSTASSAWCTSDSSRICRSRSSRRSLPSSSTNITQIPWPVWIPPRCSWGVGWWSSGSGTTASRWCSRLSLAFPHAPSSPPPASPVPPGRSPPSTVPRNSPCSPTSCPVLRLNTVTFFHVGQFGELGLQLPLIGKEFHELGTHAFDHVGVEDFVETVLLDEVGDEVCV